jgi:hypothetical protein
MQLLKGVLAYLLQTLRCAAPIDHFFGNNGTMEQQWNNGTMEWWNDEKPKGKATAWRNIDR